MKKGAVVCLLNRGLGVLLKASECVLVNTKALAIVLRTIAIAIAIEVKKSIEYCNMQ